MRIVVIGYRKANDQNVAYAVHVPFDKPVTWGYDAHFLLHHSTHMIRCVLYRSVIAYHINTQCEGRRQRLSNVKFLSFPSLQHSLVVGLFKYSLAVVTSEFFYAFPALIPEAQITFHELLNVAVTLRRKQALTYDLDDAMMASNDSDQSRLCWFKKKRVVNIGLR